MGGRRRSPLYNGAEEQALAALPRCCRGAEREAALERASLDGAELEYEVSGTGEPAVCIHGALIADTFWPLLAEPSLAGRYRLILYNRHGYAGSSRASGTVSIAQQAADCRALLRHLGVQR